MKSVPSAATPITGPSTALYHSSTRETSPVARFITRTPEVRRSQSGGTIHVATRVATIEIAATLRASAAEAEAVVGPPAGGGTVALQAVAPTERESERGSNATL